MSQQFTELSEKIQTQIDNATTDESRFQQPVVYVDSLNLSGAGRTKFALDIEAGTLTIGTLNSEDGEEVLVPLASISGNYYANLKKIERLLDNPQRYFLNHLSYVSKTVDDDAHPYDKEESNDYVIEPWK